MGGSSGDDVGGGSGVHLYGWCFGREWRACRAGGRK
jgi:hypothetical protein